jgi:hypothetical protein
MPSIFVQSDGPILIDDISCPIIVQNTEAKKAWVAKDLHDASQFTGIPREEIVAMADADEKTAKDGFRFVWPTLKEVKKHWAYPVRKPGSKSQFAIAVPVEVTLTPRPGSKKKEKLYYRSITSCCHGWSISKETFDKIANQHLGWQDSLPKMMASIRTNVKMPKNYLADGDGEEAALFSIKENRGAIVVGADAIVGRRYRRIQDVPAAVLAYSDWAGVKKPAKKGAAA